jgi:hypothetical protein
MRAHVCIQLYIFPGCGHNCMGINVKNQSIPLTVTMPLVTASPCSLYASQRYSPESCGKTSARRRPKRPSPWSTYRKSSQSGISMPSFNHITSRGGVPVNMPLWYQMKRIWVTNLKNNSSKYYISLQIISGIMEPMKWRGKSMQIAISPKSCIGRSKFGKFGAKIVMASFYGASSFNLSMTEFLENNIAKFRSYFTENITSPLQIWTGQCCLETTTLFIVRTIWNPWIRSVGRRHSFVTVK